MMNERDALLSLYSDLHKDAYGVRPRGSFDSVPLVTLQHMVEDMREAAARAAAEQRREQQVAVLKFEARLAELIAAGAADRVTALRWLSDASEARSTSDLEWEFDLPTGYLGRDAA